MPNNRIKKTTLENYTPAYNETKDVQVDDKEEVSSSSYAIPTDPALRQELQRQIQAAARARGINPETGEQTPFEVLGYNPEEERKRREAERALNDRKRKENAFYNVFAVLGDSITAALGGNVWQRQPNNIGAQANADNARLIAEQKTEDEANAAKLRANGIGFANDVNNLVKNYLTKVTEKTTTGGDRHETTRHSEVRSTRQVAIPLGDGDGSGSNSKKIMNVNTTSNGVVLKNGYKLTNNEYDAIARLIRSHYNTILNERDAEGNLTPKAEDLRKKLLTAGVLKKTTVGNNDIEQNDFDDNIIMQNGTFWEFDEPLMRRVEQAAGNKFKMRLKNGAVEIENAQHNSGGGVDRGANPRAAR